MVTNRTTVNISITPELDAFLQSRVKSGRYQTTSEVVRELFDYYSTRRPNGKNASATQSQARRGAAQAVAGELIDGDDVFNELRELIEERRRSKQKAVRS